jgi:peptidoglycan hydrolase-like protein with peptidoglycan-binding domain
VVLLLIGLAAGGVFSGGRAPKHRPPATTAPTTAATTQASTLQSPTTPQPVAPSTPLKPGDKGAAVKLLQRALARLGYPIGALDGDYGPKTQAAVLKFQRTEKLTADGIAGPATLRALRRKLAASG